MSTNRSPVGRQPQSVYWRRRLAVLGGIVVIILIVVLIIVRPGSGKPAGHPSNTPTSNPATAAACKAADVEVVAKTDGLSYAAGVDPQVSLTITNTGGKPCSFKDGSDVQKYVITSGTDTIWSSTDCQTNAVSHVSILTPGKAVASAPFAWNRTRSNAADCSATNEPQVIAKGASYHLTVTVDGITSSTANSPQFVLK
ncbi:MAG TPA: hypothetical protein VHX87_07425 [Galbitalea sp.]|nr:hypothetical protein [Galbitalea sp.]